MGILSGKRILVTGVANKRSIAHAVAQSLHKHGAELAFTYQTERLRKNVESVAAECNSSLCFECDATDDAQVEQVFADLSQTWPEGHDGFVHAIAFAPREELEGTILTSGTKEGFITAMDVSAYSLLLMARKAQPHLRAGASIVTLTFVGSTRYATNYNTMGIAKAALESTMRYIAAAYGKYNIRANAVSPGPIRTLSAAGIKGFRQLEQISEGLSLLRRNADAHEVGETVAFFCSDMASAITAQILPVDGGAAVAIASPSLAEPAD